MGSSKSKASSKTTNGVYSQQTASAAPTVAPTVTTPVADVVTPAVARDISADTESAQQNQKLARSRLSGIRSTWSTFGGSSSKLGS